MAIVRMKRLRLLAVQAQREEILHDLMLLGCVEISEPETEPDDDLTARLTRPDSSELLRDRVDQTLLQNAVRLLDKYAPAKGKFMQAPPDVALNELLDESKISADIELAQEIIRRDERIRRITAEESRERALIESFVPWQELDLPLECTGTERAAVVLGTAPAAADPAELEAAVTSATDKAKLFPISADKLQHCFMLVCLREEKDDVLAALRPFGFSPAAMDGFKGTARENIKAANDRLAGYASEKTELTAQIAAEAPHRDELKLRTETMSARISRAEATLRLLCTDSAFTFAGWVPADDEKRLAELLEKYDCAWETEEPDPEKPEEVPVKLRSNALTRPFNMVTEMYSLPSYNGVDPNPFLFPTFSLFFGIMFADIGYGLILVLAGLLFKYKLKAKGTMGYMGGIALISGVSCIIFGAITGTFFGDIINQASGFFGGSAAFNGIINPLEEPMTILIICIGIGVVHLLLGVTINGYMLVRDGHVADALWETGSIYLMFIGIALGALGVTWIVAIISVVGIIAAQGRASKSIGGKIGSGLYGLYSVVTGWFGDILSYSRLMALMLAGTVVAQVFNTLGAMTGNVVTFFIIFVAGHALNFGLNIIGTFVHTSRLEYLEFFGKFYREGGRAFQPLAIKTKNYNVCNN